MPWLNAKKNPTTPTSDAGDGGGGGVEVEQTPKGRLTGTLELDEYAG